MSNDIANEQYRSELRDLLNELYLGLVDESDVFLKSWKKLKLLTGIEAYFRKQFDLCYSAIEAGHLNSDEISKDAKYLTWLDKAEKIDEHYLERLLSKLNF